jgi:DNA-directed RNA polymerase I, II, and III subunit RPABC2
MAEQSHVSGPVRPVRTSPFLSKFEYARVVGAVALQISTTTDTVYPPGMSAMQLAREEVLQQRVPLLIRRYLPDGSHEDCSLSALRVDYLQSCA